MRTRTARWSAVLVGAVLLAGSPVLSGTSGAGPALPSAHVWVTTPDGSLRMSDRGSVAFHAGGSTALTITVDQSRT